MANKKPLRDQIRSAWRVFRILALFLPISLSQLSAEAILSSGDEEKAEKQVDKWMKSKYKELEFIGLTVCCTLG